MKLNEFFEYMDQEPVSKSPAADKLAQFAADYGKDDMDYDDLLKAAEMLRAGKLEELGKFVYYLDTDPRELIMSTIEKYEPDTFKMMYGDQEGYMSLMTPKGMKEDGMGQGSLDKFRELYRKSIGSDDAAVTLRELINVINDDSLWSDEFPQLKQFVDVSPLSGSKIVTAKKIPGNSDDEKIQSLVKAIDDDQWVNATAKHLMRSYTLGEDEMSTGTVAVGKKGKTRRATGINDNPYDHNEGEDQTALANAALWNMKDIYQTIMLGTPVEEDDMFAYGDLVQYLEQADMPDHYSRFWDLVTDAIDSAGGFAGQGDAIEVDKKIAPKIKTLYQQFKAATANIKGVKEDENDSWTKVTNALIKKFGKDKAEVITDYAQIMTDSAEEIMKSHGLTYQGDPEEDEKSWFKKYPWLEKLNNTSWMGRLFDLAGEGPDYGTPVKMQAGKQESQELGDILRLSGLK
jgi:Ca2+-binding EF-hand superfamily protein